MKYIFMCFPFRFLLRVPGRVRAKGIIPEKKSNRKIPECKKTSKKSMEKTGIFPGSFQKFYSLKNRTIFFSKHSPIFLILALPPSTGEYTPLPPPSQSPCTVGNQAPYRTPIAKMVINQGAYNALHSPVLHFGGTLFPARLDFLFALTQTENSPIS